MRKKKIGNPHSLCVTNASMICVVCACSLYESVFLVGDRRFDVFAQLLLDLRHGTVAQSDPLGEMGTVGQLRFDLLVAFEQLHGEIPRREVLGQLVAGGTQTLVQRPERLLDDRAVVDMDMAHAGIPIFVDGDHRVEQCLQTPPRLGHDGHHRHAEHRAQMLVIEYGAARFEFVVHVERHDHLGIDVDQFGGKIEITFEIRGHYGVDDHVGRVVHQMAAHVQLFGRIGREGVGAGQIGDDEPVSSVTIFAALGVDGHPAVIAHMFVAARNGVEQRGLAAIGIADQRDVDRAAARGDRLLEIRIVGCRERFPRHGELLLHLFGGDDDDHRGLAAPQRNLVIHNPVFDRVTQRGVLQNVHPLAAHETHLHDPASESAVSQYVEDRGRLSGFQFRKTHFSLQLTSPRKVNGKKRFSDTSI